MITEQQQEQAALFALGILGEEEKSHFTAELRQNGELRELLCSAGNCGEIFYPQPFITLHLL